MGTTHEAPPAAEEHSKPTERSQDADSAAQSIGEHARDIEAGGPQTTSDEPQTSAPSSKRKYALFALLAAIGLVLLVWFGWSLSKKNKATVEEPEAQVEPEVPESSVVYLRDLTQISMKPAKYTSDPRAKHDLLLKALSLKTKLLSAHANANEAAPYFVKAIQITPNVFRAVDPNQDYVNQVDNTLAVPNIQYSNEPLTTLKQVEDSFQSEFEWKHFYVFYSILEIDDIDNLNFYKLFCLIEAESDKTEAVNSIVARLFNCLDSDGEYLSGVKLLNGILKSDFYNVLVTIYAKSAVIIHSKLDFGTDSLSSRFPMWFQVGSIPCSGQSILSFLQDFIGHLHHAFYYGNPNLLLKDYKTISLQSVLHHSLLWTFALDQHSHPYFTRMDSLLSQHGLKLNDYYNEFAKFTKAQSGGIPVFPETSIALLPDVFQPEDQPADA